MPSSSKLAILTALILLSTLFANITPVYGVQAQVLSQLAPGAPCQLTTETGVQMQYVKNCYYEIGVNTTTGVISYAAIVDGSNKSIYDTSKAHGGAGLLTEELDGTLHFTSSQVSINMNNPNIVEEGITGDIITQAGEILSGSINMTFFANEPFFIASMSSSIDTSGIHYGHDFANFVNSTWGKVWAGPGTDGSTTEVCNSNACSTYSQAESVIDTAPDIKSLIQRNSPVWGWLGNSSSPFSNVEGVGFLLLGLNSTNPIEAATSHYEVNLGDFEIEGTGVAPADYVALGQAPHNLEYVTAPQTMYGAFLVYLNAAPYTTFEKLASGSWQSAVVGSYLGSSYSNAAFAQKGPSADPNPAGPYFEDWYITNLATSTSFPVPSSSNGILYFTGRNNSLANDFPMKTFLNLNGHTTADSNFATTASTVISSGSGGTTAQLQVVWNDTKDGIGLSMVLSAAPNSDKINVTGSLLVTGSSLSVQTLSLEEKLFANYLDGTGLPAVSSTAGELSWNYQNVGVAVLLPSGNGFASSFANDTRGYLNLVNSTSPQILPHGKSLPFKFAVSFYDPISNFSPNYVGNIYVPTTKIFTQPFGNASQVGFAQDHNMLFSYLESATQYDSNGTIANMRFIKPFSGDLEVYYAGNPASVGIKFSNGTAESASNLYNSQTKTFNFDVSSIIWATLYTSAIISTTTVECTPNSVSVGSQTTCTATVRGSNPTGAVSWQTSGLGTFSFNNCNLSLSTCSVNYTPTSNSSSPVTITALYSGDASNSASSGTFSLNVPAGKIPITISCSPFSVSVGSSTTCTVTVSEPNLQGPVNFASSDAGAKFTPKSSCTLTSSSSSSSCQVTYKPSRAGTATITASYGGGSTSISLVVSGRPLSPNLLLISIIAGVVAIVAIAGTLFVRRRYYY